MNKFYLTTAINYPNGEPHIGHAYEAIAADAIARFKRLDGDDVFLLTGTDEHGQKMMRAAERNGTTVQELADANSERFRELTSALNISHDRFIRTTEACHHEAAQELWRRMSANGHIYKDKYSGWYSVRDESFYAEAETEVNPAGVRIAKETGKPVEWMEEESYFFRLSDFEQKLLDFHDANPGFIAPESRRNEVVSFLKGGLDDLSISRTSFDWGVPVPDDPEHVMYVWVDALANYLSGVGFPNPNAFDWKFWPADLHIIGKDIIRFHAVYWPAFLMAADLPLPRKIFAHGHLLFKGVKMGKSEGNGIDPFALVETYGVDQVRYFLLRGIPFGQDGNYSNETIVNRINADLANDLGNLAKRTLSMIAKHFNGEIPAPGTLTDQDRSRIDFADGLLERCRIHMDNLEIHRALETVWEVVRGANRYIDQMEPWQLKESDPMRMGTVLYVTAVMIHRSAMVAQFAMPDACGRILEQMGVEFTETSFGWIEDDLVGNQLGELEIVFPRIRKDD